MAKKSKVVPVVPAPMKQLVLFDGSTHPVTSGWYADHISPHPELEGMDEAGIRGTLRALLDISNTRPLTDAERIRIHSLDAIISVNNAWALLKGTDYAAEYGFDGVDQVHFNSHTLACGCICHVVFDHHKARKGEDHQHHVHAPLKSCAAHAHLKHDWKAHHDAAKADAVAAIKE
jgi:hypothetical protein